MTPGHELQCDRCGYSLKGAAPGTRCPECGLTGGFKWRLRSNVHDTIAACCCLAAIFCAFHAGRVDFGSRFGIVDVLEVSLDVWRGRIDAPWQIQVVALLASIGLWALVWECTRPVQWGSTGVRRSIGWLVLFAVQYPMIWLGVPIIEVATIASIASVLARRMAMSNAFSVLALIVSACSGDYWYIEAGWAWTTGVCLSWLWVIAAMTCGGLFAVQQWRSESKHLSTTQHEIAQAGRDQEDVRR